MVTSLGLTQSKFLQIFISRRHSHLTLWLQLLQSDCSVANSLSLYGQVVWFLKDSLTGYHCVLVRSKSNDVSEMVQDDEC